MTEPAKVESKQEAPDFCLTDTQNQPVVLSGFRGKRVVVLVFNRAFA